MSNGSGSAFRVPWLSKFQSPDYDSKSDYCKLVRKVTDESVSYSNYDLQKRQLSYSGVRWWCLFLLPGTIAIIVEPYKEVRYLLTSQDEERSRYLKY